MKKYTLSLIISSVILSLLFFIYSCEDEEQNHNPTCSITAPLQDAEIMKGETVTITVSADDEDGNLKEVRFYIDDSGVSSISTFPYSYVWNTSSMSLGNHIIKAEAIDEKNVKNEHSINIIIIDNQVVADFSSNKTSISLGETLNFIDESTSSPTSWYWDFGDSNTSTEQNPSHIYSSIGNYTVKLKIENDFSIDSISKTEFISVKIVPTVLTKFHSTTNESANIGCDIANIGNSDIVECGVYYGTSLDFINTGTRLVLGTDSGSFIQNITQLSELTTYYICAFATNEIGTGYGDTIRFATFGLVNDIDGNSYYTVLIGEQIWIAENLQTNHYADGTPLIDATDSATWIVSGDYTTKYYYPGNNNNSHFEDGNYYSWAAVMNGEASSSNDPSGIQGVCPDGWHIPSELEWNELVTFLGGLNIAGDKLKSESGWLSWCTANNQSQFSAVDARYHSPGVSFTEGESETYFWTTTEKLSSSAITFKLNCGTIVSKLEKGKDYGYSVRCVKD